jgi:hypothetical protein
MATIFMTPMQPFIDITAVRENAPFRLSCP